ncbi:hypothetical protein QYF36_004852 [Acer negundo]|nr:hypothetical protein QYF36_004852 [Acer negundo]
MPNPKTLRETQQNPKTYNNNQGQKTPNVSLYEQSREERIKDNLQRMQKLGILDLSDKLKSSVRPKRTPRNSPSDSQGSTSLLQSEPRRRSSRLQNVTPVSYSERPSNRDDCVKDEDLRLEQGSKPEVYTEKQEKLLGNTERSWTLFVDGYGTDGKRIYDPVKGKTCHQCRQKTLGHRTQCSECNKVQGQFCGDCLYMRYGEHVLETNENPNWICPVCRGICNCSLCRQAKGWCPTGALYKKISNLGFKSVAHYLIETHRLQTNLEKNPDSVNQASSVKRSLSFKGMEALLEESSKVDKDQNDNKDLDIEKENKLQNHSYAITNHQTAAKRSLPFSYIEAEPDNNSTEDVKVLNHIELYKPRLEDQRDSGVKDEQEKKLHYNDKQIALKGSPKPKKKRAAVVPSPDSIAGRLRQRRRKVDDGLDNMELVLYVGLPASNNLSEKEKEMQTCNDEHGDRNETSDVSPKLEGKPAVTIEPNLDNTAVSSEEAGPDSIARRLRSRKQTT